MQRPFAAGGEQAGGDELQSTSGSPMHRLMHASRRKNVLRSARIGSLVLVGCLFGGPLAAQTEYHNTDGGHPTRVEDATPTERFALDVHFPTAKVERIAGVTRLRVEPALSYGVLPRTAIEARAAFVYREPAAVPRGGMTGIGLGVMHALFSGSARVPGVAMAAEFHQPIGSAKTGGPAYSLRTMVTQSLGGVRLHANATLGTYNVTVQQTDPGCIRARLPVVDQSCSGEPIPPVIPDGPCSVAGLDAGVGVTARCDAHGLVRATSPTAAVATTVQKLRGTHRVIGAGGDYAFTRSFVLIMADVFGEQYVGLFDHWDWTAEVGARHQMSSFVTIDASVGRRFAGTTTAWVITAGLTRTVATRRP